MTILAIDTSCDETAAAVTEATTVLSNVVASQASLHKKYGGVFPTVAKQAHTENIKPVVLESLKRARVSWDDINAIAVTQGPGLAPALEIGLQYAKELSKYYNKHLIPVNHIEGHVLSVLGVPRSKQTGLADTEPISPKMPAISIIVSGGHTEFILVEDVATKSKRFDYTRLGWTIDDAAGEALDKIGRMLDLGYPAGPVIEQLAKNGDPNSYAFPLPMTTSGDYNLSFSGLKTFARNLISELEQSRSLSKQDVCDLAASTQFAVFRHITHKLAKVLDRHPKIQAVWLGGGVAANTQLRKAVSKKLREHSAKKELQPLMLRTPYTKKLCGDNAAMIGVAAYFHQKEVQMDKLERKPRYRIDSND